MEDRKYKINTDLLQVFDKLRKYFEEYSKDTAFDNDPKIFDKIAKATIVKSYQFNLSITSLRDDHIFFMLPALRGICEEYIVEKFIFNYFTTDKDYILQLWQQHELYKSSIAQWKYFGINKPDQRLYYKETFPDELKEIENTIKKSLEKKFPKVKKNPFPSVYFMAEKGGLLELYKYLYHATSTFVHFHPNNLMRMGWGDLPDIQFSTTHFEKYYNYFTVFHSAMLFCELCNWQIESGYLVGFNNCHIKTIREILNNESRYPEIITFEEMNIGALSRHLFFNSPSMILNQQSKA